MDPLFTEGQLNRMSREDILTVMKAMQQQCQKQETKIHVLEEKTKELEFLNAMLSDRLILAQRKQFGTSSEKYADCNTKYKVVAKELVKRLKFIPARFEVVDEVTYVYICPKCGAMKRPEKAPSLLKGSVAPPPWWQAS